MSFSNNNIDENKILSSKNIDENKNDVDLSNFINKMSSSENKNDLDLSNSLNKMSLSDFKKPLVSDLNKGDNFRLDKNAYIRTCALILYDREKGYLLCEELRKDFPRTNKKMFTHMIAGKVEMTDRIPFDTALREFCEELPFKLNGLTIEETVKVMKSSFISCRKKYIDFSANIKRTLYNRLYVVDISDLSSEFSKELNNQISGEREGSSLSNVFWYSGDNFEIESTSMVNDFIANLPEF